MTNAALRRGEWPRAGTIRVLDPDGDRGRAAGAAWAADTAENVELKRLAAIAVHLRFDDEQIGSRIVSAILGERHLSKAELVEFRGIVGLDDDDAVVESGAYWSGFVDGALELFDRVEL